MDQIIDIRKNCMGTLDIMAKFNKMRKPQEFTVYPIGEDDSVEKIKIQSKTRIGYINLNTGIISLCNPVANGAYNMHLIFVRDVGILSEEELVRLKNKLISTAGKRVGNNWVGIFSDNSGVEKIAI